MARPAKSVDTMLGARTKAELAARKETEEKLRGGNDALIAPEHLTDAQKNIFNFIIENLEQSGILGNLDFYVLAYASVTIEQMIQLDIMLNNCHDIKEKAKIITTRKNLSSDYFRCLNELCLSPQSRAKMSIANMQSVAKKGNSLLTLIGDDDD